MAWLARNYRAIVVLLLAAIVFAVGCFWANSGPSESGTRSGDYTVYETARVTEILSDSCAPDPVADNAYRGEQMLTAELLTGDFAGDTLLCHNTCGPIYNQPVAVGDKVVLCVSVYATGERYATVYEYSRAIPLLLLALLFLAVTVVVGGKTGLKSLVGLGVTVAGLIFILIPALLKGAPTVVTTFALCAFVAVVSFTILGGINRKTVCAMLGTLGGMLMAALFGLLGQWLCRINGMRQEYIEPLLQLRQTGASAIGLKGLLTAGILISALGAVMDVAMSVSSALSELKAVDGSLTFRKLMKSGMNIGRDMVGTMTNTLILAFFGSALVLVIYMYTLSLDPQYLLNSAFLSLEVVSALASSIGVILSVPLTCAIAAGLFGRKEKQKS